MKYEYTIDLKREADFLITVFDRYKYFVNEETNFTYNNSFKMILNMITELTISIKKENQLYDLSFDFSFELKKENEKFIFEIIIDEENNFNSYSFSKKEILFIIDKDLKENKKIKNIFLDELHRNLICSVGELKDKTTNIESHSYLEFLNDVNNFIDNNYSNFPFACQNEIFYENFLNKYKLKSTLDFKIKDSLVLFNLLFGAFEFVKKI